MNRMTKTPRIFAALAAVAMLAGCMGGGAATDVPVQPAGIEPLPTMADDGLTERKPDACKASTYANYVGQPGAVIPTLGITREYRVVEFRGIEPQEYNPLRIVFRLDGAGLISGVDCG